MEYGEYFTYGSIGGSFQYQILNSGDRFRLIDDYLLSLSESSRLLRPRYLNMIISVRGEIITQEDGPIDLESRKLEINRSVDVFQNIGEVAKIVPFRSYMQKEEANNYNFGLPLQKEMARYGLRELYPLFYGIEIGMAISIDSIICKCNSLVCISGSDTDSFYNARTLMK